MQVVHGQPHGFLLGHVLVANPLQKLTGWTLRYTDISRSLASSLVLLCQACTAAICTRRLLQGAFCLQPGLRQVQHMMSWPLGDRFGRSINSLAVKLFGFLFWMLQRFAKTGP